MTGIQPPSVRRNWPAHGVNRTGNPSTVALIGLAFIAAGALAAAVCLIAF